MKRSGVLAIILLVVVAAILEPVFIIWSLNTLFPVLAVPYTVKTWFAVLGVSLLFVTKVNTKK